MARIQQATTILTDLKTHIEEQTRLANVEAAKNNVAGAKDIIDAAITYSTSEQNRAQRLTQDSVKSKAADKHTAELQPYNDAKALITPLHKAMLELQETYAVTIKPPAALTAAQREIERLNGLLSEKGKPAAEIARLQTENTELKAKAAATVAPDVQELQETIQKHVAEKDQLGARNIELEDEISRLKAEIAKPDADAPHKDEPADPHAEPEKDLDEDAYQQAWANLQALRAQDHPEKKEEFEKVNVHLDKFLATVDELKNKGSEHKKDLTEALIQTYHRLTGNLPPKAYEDIAETMQGKPSLGLQILGGVMLALAAAVVALGVVYFPVLLTAAAVLTLTGATATIVTASTLGVTGAGLAAGSLGLFAAGYQKGLSRDMRTLDEEVLKNETVWASPAA